MFNSNHFQLRALAFLTILFACILATGRNCQGQDDVSRFFAEITDRVQDNYEYLKQLYFHLHSHPEISLHEEQTSKRLAS